MKDYPSLLPYRKRSVLPEDLQRVLLKLGQALEKKQVPREPLETALAGLGAMPPSLIVSAAVDVAPLALPYMQPNGGRLDYFALLARHPGLARLYLFHWNGYMREAGLHALVGPITTPFWMAAVIFRLNDWVPQVRLAALACLRRCLRGTDVTILALAAFSLLPKRSYWKRGHEIGSALDELTATPGVLAVLATRIGTAYDGGPHRTFIALLRYPEIDRYLPDLTRAAHPVVRAIAFATQLSRQARWPVGTHYEWIDKSMGQQKLMLSFETRSIDVVIPQDDLIAQAAIDRSAQVRKVAMQALIDDPRAWAERQPLIDILAKDRSPAIRAGIDYILRQQAKSH